MLVAHYRTKKDLKNSIGKELRFSETSMFGPEYGPNKTLTVVGPDAYQRKWFAMVQMKDGIIKSVK